MEYQPFNTKAILQEEQQWCYLTFSKQDKLVILPCYIKKGVKQMSGRVYWWVPKILMSAWERTLYCESFKGKKAVVDIRAGIKHPTWSFKDELV